MKMPLIGVSMSHAALPAVLGTLAGINLSQRLRRVPLAAGFSAPFQTDDLAL
jgi:hypothetical protein